MKKILSSLSGIPFLKINWSIFLLAALFWSCSEDPEPEVPVENKFLVESSLKSEYNESFLKTLAGLGGYGSFTDIIRNDIEIYRLKYKTTVGGQEVIASGVISIPTNVSGAIPFLSAHRGTIFGDDEAPSEANPFYAFELFAAAGYATVLPDMIGFGETKDMVQHYYNKEANSQVAIDMMHAGREFLRGKDIELNDQLFLLGYSQGGFITIATQQAIESDPALNWDITAVAAGAGSYNIEFVMDDVINRGIFTAPGFLSLIVYSFNEVNGFGKSMDYYFQEPYASQIPDLLDGSSGFAEVNAALSDTLSVYFQSTFVDGLKNRTETEMINAFRANSVQDWKPNAPVRLYHSSGDQYIPIEDSQQTAEVMSKNGADVTFIQVGDKSHSAASVDMVIEAVPWFESLRTDL
ncbi:lipase family protein [Flexithrix dorotheae]|uniref:lipase family protein n=1 Tax=Flexithrix dorotheae TaxID=70993 RepID=UPI000375E01D|nr:lipase family protein [Flexithrix dorotheae]